MLAREDIPKSKTIKSGNQYFDIVYEAYAKADSNGRRTNPNPADILYDLLNLYFKNSQKTFLYLFPGANHTHASEVATCIHLREKNKSFAAIGEALNELNKIQKINPNGALEQLLGLYFSVFPQYLDKVTNEILLAAIRQHQSTTLWDQPAAMCLQDFMRIYREKPDNIHHEQLAQASAGMTKEMAEEFADFLLEQYHQNRPESRAGLYNGWIAVSLGLLNNKLSAAKRKLIIERLLTHLNANKTALTTIGLCDALGSLVTDKDVLIQIADRLQRYALKEIPDILDLFGDHHRSTIALYMPKLFSALTKLEAHLEPRMKSNIVGLLLEPRHLYPLRHGIRTLQHWQTEAQTKQLIAALAVHPEFIKLITTFSYFLLPHALKEDNLDFQRRYDLCVDAAKKIMLSESIDIPQVTDLMKLLLTDPHLADQNKADILAALVTKLKKASETATRTEQSIALHQALALGKDWCNHPGKINIGTLLVNAAKKSAQTHDEMALYAATSAAEFSEFLKPTDTYALRDILISLLDTKYQNEAALALRTFATDITHEQLPELMTRLMTYSHPQACLLLVDIHKHYQYHNQDLKSSTKHVL